MEPIRPPLGDPLAEATHYLRIYFAPGSEGARAVATMLAALDDAQRELAATKAERDALRATAPAPDVAPRIAAAARLDDAAELALRHGATFTAQVLTKAAQNLTLLRHPAADSIAERLLRSPNVHDTTTRQETA